MIFRRKELTDSHSVRLRFFHSLLWSIPWLVVFWFLVDSMAMLAILAAAFLYLSLVGLVFDSRRLKHPDTPTSDEHAWRMFAILPLFIGIPLALFFLR